MIRSPYVVMECYIHINRFSKLAFIQFFILFKSVQLQTKIFIICSYPVIAFTRYEWQDTLATIFLQALPAYIMDFFNPEKIKLMAVCRKVKSMKNVINFFMQKKLFFDNKNVVNVYDR